MKISWTYVIRILYLEISIELQTKTIKIKSGNQLFVKVAKPKPQNKKLEQ